MTVEQASQEIEDGFASLRTALGDPKAVAPFFRIPGLLRQELGRAVPGLAGLHDLERRLRWPTIGPISTADEVARRAISRHRGQAAAASCCCTTSSPPPRWRCPTILRELKARGFKIVHVVPATPDRPKTVTEPELWALRYRSACNSKYWPRVVARRSARRARPALAAPNPGNFGLMDPREAAVKVALTPSFDRPLPAMEGVWPRGRAGRAIRVPAAEEHICRCRPAQFPLCPACSGADKLKLASRKPATTTPATGATPAPAKPKDPHSTGSPPATNGPRPPRMIGHQLSVARPPFPFLR